TRARPVLLGVLRAPALALGVAARSIPATARLLVRLRGGVLEGRADLIHVQLNRGPVVALAVRERALLEVALRDDAGALLKRLGHVLGGVAPDGEIGRASCRESG